MELDEPEQAAVSQFLDENWDAFRRVALQYLSDSEIEDLGDRFANRE